MIDRKIPVIQYINQRMVRTGELGVRSVSLESGLGVVISFACYVVGTMIEIEKYCNIELKVCVR